MTDKINNSLVIKNVEKKFDNVIALNKISLKVSEGEFCTLLGASGSGKTTLLRVIAGFEPIDNGSIQINGKNVETLSIANRNIGMVFQNYALFPHMSVRENIAFGLKMRKLNKLSIEKKTNEALSLVNLINEAERFPNQLSGGQQQRVALARAIIIKPSILLMDEPLGALDKNLRKEMQAQIKELHKNINVTVIYVTHDQEEALYLSDRIVLLDKGDIIQSGNSRDLYQKPKNKMVASFLGECNFITLENHQKVVLRPESFKISNKKTNDNNIEIEIKNIVFLGSYTKLIGYYNNQEITAMFHSNELQKSIDKNNKLNLTYNDNDLIDI
jgi:ABC-type Fe3+/spermidine/putrescine transport system ATPase subunit